ncbi:MAG: phosphoglycolate phosphatase [Pseudomonadota bacterium]
MARLPTAVVFDLDGTLIDSASDLHTAAARLLAEEGLPPPSLAAVRGMIGEGVGRLVERLFAAADTPLGASELERLSERFRALYLERPCVSTELLPGARSALEALAEAGHRLGLCTNKPGRHTGVILEALGITPLLPVVVAGDSLPVRKPDPAPLLLALDRLGVPPERSLFVGDSAIDARTARAAGTGLVLVDGGYAHEPLAALAPDVLIPTLKALPAAVAAWVPALASTGQRAGSGR